MNSLDLRNLSYQSLLDLSTENGINASGKEGVFGAFFGRDSAITILKILRVHSKKPSIELLEIARKGLLALIRLQGKEINLESGEEPGKFIHEYRSEKFDHLLTLEKPWFIYPEGVLKNYDSIDSTPLGLIAIYKYWQITGDGEFLLSVLPGVEQAIKWILNHSDKDQDGLIEYEFALDRKSGGLNVQSWTDSHESLRNIDGQMPKYPVAPVEVQAYAWLALKLWSDFYKKENPKFSKSLNQKAKQLKWAFNKNFIFKDKKLYYAAQAIDGNKKKILTVTGNPLLCLWAAYQKGRKTSAIINSKYVPAIVKRSFQKDMFDSRGGLRTMSMKSPTFNPGQTSYHNGSFWPILNGLAAEGLENFCYIKEATRLKKATLCAMKYFQSPIELYIKSREGSFLEYQSPTGQVSCRIQAWSAAATLDFLT